MAVRAERGGRKGPSRKHSNDAAAAALHASAAFFALAQAYQEELDHAVFPARFADPAKPRLANQRLLASLNTLPVLVFIWKESPFVTAGTLRRTGITRMMQGGPLTMQSLTMLLNGDTRGAGRAAHRVARIVRAGVAYGLLETRQVRDTMIEVAGTEALHKFMLRVRAGQALKLPRPEAEEF